MKVNTDQNLAERFEVAFNQIHKWLMRNNNRSHSDKFTDLLRACSPLHSIIRKNYDDLVMFARLRNSIVHEKIGEGFYIAEPHESVVEKIEKIAALIFQPKAALEIGSCPVFYYFDNAPLKNILTIVKKKSHSIFPIYDEKGYKFLLTAECIIQWFAENLSDSTINLDDVQVKHLEGLSKSPAVEFMGRDSDMFEVEEIFEQYHLKNIKLEAVIITENGRMTEKPIGIVTSWDLVEIDTLD